MIEETKNKQLTVLSLFDGMSCGQIALDQLGYSHEKGNLKYYASEIKPYGIQVVQENYPQTTQVGDITKLEFKDGVLDNTDEKWEIGEVDLLIGGTPCQNFSIACIPSKRLGLKGEKSSLFYEYLRLLNEVKPKYFFLENVASMRKEDQKAISEYLGVEPIKINSKVVTAQLRNRLYWTNIPQHSEIQEKDIELSEILTSGYTDRKKSRALMEGDSRPTTTQYRRFHRYQKFNNLIFKDEEHYNACKIHYDTHFKGLSAKEIDKKIEADNINLEVYEGIRYLNKTERERLQGVPEGYTKSLTENHAASLLGDGWTVPVIKHLFKGLLDKE